MRKARPDQAEGLRKLVSAPPSCAVIALAAAAEDVGKRTVAANLATALAAGGRKVVLLQGAPASAEISLQQALGALERAVHPQSIAGVCTQLDNISAALRGSAAPSVAVLAAPELFFGLQLWRAAQLNSVRRALARVSEAADVLLLDAPVDAPCRPAQQLGTRCVTLVVTPSQAVITATYRMLKSLPAGVQQAAFQVIVNKARDLDQARRVFDNIAYAVRRYLSSSIDFSGYLTRDNAFQRDADSVRTVVERMPESAAAQQLRALANHLLPSTAAAPAATDLLLRAVRGEHHARTSIHSSSLEIA